MITKRQNPAPERSSVRGKQKIILKGIGASAGIAKGKVKVISDPAQHDKMKKGDILVTKFTTPLLIPAILKAAGIVTDKGGMMCHAAVVSREFGIPCIVGAEKATKILTDNVQITIDGKEGIIYK